MEQLGTSENKPSEFQGVRGQNIKETKPTLLKTMFFIENTPFDQVRKNSLLSLYLHFYNGERIKRLC